MLSGTPPVMIPYILVIDYMKEYAFKKYIGDPENLAQRAMKAIAPVVVDTLRNGPSKVGPLLPEMQRTRSNPKILAPSANKPAR